MLQERQHIEFVTRRSGAMQGVFLVLVGLLVVSVSAWRIWILPHIDQMFVDILGVGLAVGIVVLFVRVLLYNARTFGHVKLAPKDFGPFALKHAGFFTFCWLGDAFDAAYHWPVSTEGLLLGVGLLAYWWLMDRQPMRYLFCSWLIILLGFFPQAADFANFHLFTVGIDPFRTIVNFSIGLIFILCGTLDHLQLVRAYAAVAQMAQSPGRLYPIQGDK